MPSSLLLVVGLLLSVVSCVTGQGGPNVPVAQTVTVGAQYTATQTFGLPPMLTQTAPQYAFVGDDPTTTDEQSAYPIQSDSSLTRLASLLSHLSPTHPMLPFYTIPTALWTSRCSYLRCC